MGKRKSIIEYPYRIAFYLLFSGLGGLVGMVRGGRGGLDALTFVG